MRLLHASEQGNGQTNVNKRHGQYLLVLFEKVRVNLLVLVSCVTKGEAKPAKTAACQYTY